MGNPPFEDVFPLQKDEDDSQPSLAVGDPREGTVKVAVSTGRARRQCQAVNGTCQACPSEADFSDGMVCI